MKVTANIPDDIISDVQSYTGGKNITDSLIKALNDWLYTKRLEKLQQDIVNEPIEFNDDYSAKSIRDINNEI